MPLVEGRDDKGRAETRQAPAQIPHPCHLERHPWHDAVHCLRRKGGPAHLGRTTDDKIREHMGVGMIIERHAAHSVENMAH